MIKTSKSKRALVLLGFVVATATLSSCSSEEQFAFLANFSASPQPASIAPGLSDASLARLARCESGGNPRAVSRGHRFLGLYQFDQRTWNGVAKSVLPDYVGMSPADAPADIQSAMARALHASRGRAPWPVCGRQM